MLADNEKTLNQISDELIREFGKIIQSKNIFESNWKSSIEIINLTHMKIR